MICGKCSCDKLSIIWIQVFLVKFIYSEKATHFCEISTVDLSYVVMVKSTVEISQKFLAFLEYMNFNSWLCFIEEFPSVSYWTLNISQDPKCSLSSSENNRKKSLQNAPFCNALGIADLRVLFSDDTSPETQGSEPSGLGWDFWLIGYKNGQNQDQ